MQLLEAWTTWVGVDLHLTRGVAPLSEHSQERHINHMQPFSSDLSHKEMGLKGYLTHETNAVIKA